MFFQWSWLEFSIARKKYVWQVGLLRGFCTVLPFARILCPRIFLPYVQILTLHSLEHFQYSLDWFLGRRVALFPRDWWGLFCFSHRLSIVCPFFFFKEKYNSKTENIPFLLPVWLHKQGTVFINEHWKERECLS